MYISCSDGRDNIPLALIFVHFPFSGGIGKRSSAGYDRKVPEYTEFLRKIQPRHSGGEGGAFLSVMVMMATT